MNRIIVLSSYRTGSTAFCDALSRQLNITNYDELFHQTTNSGWTKKKFFYNRIRAGKFIIKVMPDQVLEPYFTDLVKHCKIYGIFRKDVIAQIASYYIAKSTKKWHDTDPAQSSYSVPCNIEHIKSCYEKIRSHNKSYVELFRPLCHIEYEYENIKDTILMESSYKKMQKPVNYEEIIDCLKNISQGSIDGILH